MYSKIGILSAYLAHQLFCSAFVSSSFSLFLPNPSIIISSFFNLKILEFTQWYAEFHDGCPIIPPYTCEYDVVSPPDHIMLDSAWSLFGWT